MAKNSSTTKDNNINPKHETCKIPKFFNHLTLTTGHCRESFLIELDSEFSIRAHLEKVMVGADAVPNFAQFTAQAEVVDAGKILVSVHRGKELQVKFLIVDRNDAVSKGAFERLLATDLLGAAACEPAAPYCSVSISITTITVASALFWIADYERCLAWEWFKMMSEVTTNA